MEGIAQNRGSCGIRHQLQHYGVHEHRAAVSFQPPFSTTQTNVESATLPLTLQNGFPPPASGLITNSYAVDPNYRLGYVQIWNLDVQQEIRPTVVLNLDYTGTKGTRLDIQEAPNRTATGVLFPTVQPFIFETSLGNSIAHAGSVRLRNGSPMASRLAARIPSQNPSMMPPTSAGGLPRSRRTPPTSQPSAGFLFLINATSSALITWLNCHLVTTKCSSTRKEFSGRSWVTGSGVETGRSLLGSLSRLRSWQCDGCESRNKRHFAGGCYRSSGLGIRSQREPIFQYCCVCSTAKWAVWQHATKQHHWPFDSYLQHGFHQGLPIEGHKGARVSRPGNKHFQHTTVSRSGYDREFALLRTHHVCRVDAHLSTNGEVQVLAMKLSTSKAWLHKSVALMLAALMLPISGFPQQSTDYTFRAQTELVLVNVTVRDRNGNFVRDLKADDFTVQEDNKSQKVASFDIENTDALPPSPVPQVSLLNSMQKPTAKAPENTPNEPSSSPVKDRRLIVLFFDLTSMQPDEIERASTAALTYVDKQMTAADLVSVISLGSSMSVNQDFTSDRDLLKKTLQAFNTGGGQGFEEGPTGSTEGTADTGGSFTADDTEYNIFNTDRRLEALRSISASLAKVDQKKSLIYFSGGMDRTGIENQSQLRAAINAAVRSNLAIYTMDIRGLQAMVPGGEAQNASLRGVAPYSGQSSVNALNSNFSSQETLVTLAGDTGGKAFLDSNDFGQVFKQVQQDTATYYIFGYHSTNATRDGRYRRITVRLNRPGLKLEYRKGYYAPADFQHANKEDRELQLEEEMASDFPTTDLPVYLATGYFRLEEKKFYVPVSIVVPGLRDSVHSE